MESEKAKAKAGKLYDANNDIELVSEREACKEVCYELNSLRPSQKKERESIIRRLFGKTGKSFLILPDMPWMRNRESRGLNMPILSLSEIMCGLVPRSVCCRG